jgi:hypothetical protein
MSKGFFLQSHRLAVAVAVAVAVAGLPVCFLQPCSSSINSNAS